MRAFFISLVVAFQVVVLPALFAQSPATNLLPAKQAAAVDQAIQEEMTKQNAIGVAIGIIQNGKIVYVSGYGFADRENQVPVSTDTVFNWASNSKPVAAVAAMQLAEKKLLDLDEDVRKYVPEFPDKGTKITTRHLLSHQSGIPHYSNGRVIATKRRYRTRRPFQDPVVALDRFNRSPLIFPPGEKSDYSSYAYILASAVVQRAGKESFYSQVQNRIAKPLSLTSFQPDVETNNQQNWAVGYRKNSRGDIVRSPEEANYWKHGAGAYKSNIRDFARWAQALINGELVRKETEKLMWTPQSTSKGTKTHLGLGFVIGDQGGLKVSHNGSQKETKTRMVLYPGAKHGLVVMCNCQFANPGAFSTAAYKALSQK